MRYFPACHGRDSSALESNCQALKKILLANANVLQVVASLKPPRCGKLKKPSDESPPNIDYKLSGKLAIQSLTNAEELMLKESSV